MSDKNHSSSDIAAKRHSLAHLLAAAVMELWPDTKRAIGPAIDNGFYYDFQFSQPISDDDLKKIEKKMREIIRGWDLFTKHMLSAEQAKQQYPDNPFKHELIEEFSKDGQELSFYKSGTFWDLCKGGHVERMTEVKPDSFKLSHIAGAYWRGDEKNPQLTRIYGLAFDTKEELNAYITQQEEAKKRDHKKLGPQLDLFTFSELVGPGLPLWTPRGTLVRNILDDYVWSLRKKHGYQQVDIPHITKKDLYVTSGHWDKYKDDLFRVTTREGHEFAMKPMNCPHHTQIFNRKPHSYREMPQRYANTTKVYRDEQSGELAGISRVLSITQDDAHVFCRMSQAKEEALKIWDIIQAFYQTFGIPLQVRLSVRDPHHPEKYLGDASRWELAENVLREIVTERQMESEDGLGEAAFYGPKLDFMGKDAIGREHQVATIQLDFNQPERFDLTCINEHGEKERIVMIHAAIMGSLERFLALLIEHTAGTFPLWLSPVQVAVLPISEKVADYADQILVTLRDAGIRVELDGRNESIGKKIREAELQKTPYLVVIGEKEAAASTVAIRKRSTGDTGAISLDEFLKNLAQEIKEKR